MVEEPKKVSKGILKTADQYIARMKRGEKIVRDSRGRMQWTDGRNVGPTTVRYLMDNHLIAPLDTDLFGDASRGQTIGLAQ